MNSVHDFCFKKRAVVLSAAVATTASTFLWRWSRKKTTATHSPTTPHNDHNGSSTSQHDNASVSSSQPALNAVPSLYRYPVTPQGLQELFFFYSRRERGSFPFPPNVKPWTPRSFSAIFCNDNNRNMKPININSLVHISEQHASSLYRQAATYCQAPTGSSILQDSAPGTSSNVAAVSPFGFITVDAWIEQDNDYTKPKWFRLTRRLGSGSFGNVWGATDEHGMKVALKVFKNRSKKGEVDNSALKEYKLLAEFCSFKGFTEVYGLFKETSKEARNIIVMECLDGANVQQYVEFYGGRIDEGSAAKVIFQVANALCCLHISRVVHRDVKPLNIMVCGRGGCDDVKLLDFGLTTRLDDVDLGKKPPGTKLFRAPEMFSGVMYGNSVDTFALGATLYTMILGKMPFDTEELVKGDAEVTFPKLMPKDLKDLLQRMLDKNASRRPSMRDVVNHPWVQLNIKESGS